MNGGRTEIRVKVWDRPTRLIHWLLVSVFGVLWWTAKTGIMQWHIRAGYLLLFLLLFRVYWGFVGSSTARFAGFLRGPSAVANYVRGLLHDRPVNALGHNPLGGWSICILLTLLVTDVTLGLLAVDVDGVYSGPFSRWVSFDSGRHFAHLHALLFDVLIGFVVLHVGAVLFYLLFKKKNLIMVMVTGSQFLDSTEEQQAPPTFAHPILALAGILLAGTVAWLVASL
jgi:cytochrome b